MAHRLWAINHSDQSFQMSSILGGQKNNLSNLNTISFSTADVQPSKIKLFSRKQLVKNTQQKSSIRENYQHVTIRNWRGKLEYAVC